MLLSLLLTLQPLQTGMEDPQKPPPPWWGRAAHALLLDTVRRQNPRLAEQLHAADQAPRPFTVSTLIGPSTRNGLQTGREYTLRLTSLHEDLSRLLLHAAEAGPLAPGHTVELDYLPFRVTRIQPAPSPDPQSPTENPDSQTASPWAARTTYQELSAPWLLAKETPRRHISLQLTSPASFKTRGRTMPIPLPDLVFGSLLQRWNAFAPVVFPDELKRYAAECLAISRFDLSSRSVQTKSRGRRVGAIGRITFVSLNYDRYWMSLTHTLAAFALFSGIGAGTTMGLGQARKIDKPR